MIATNLITGLFAIGAIAGFYFAPTMIAAARHVPNLGSIAVVNFFLGWTLIGWIVALAWSMKTVTREERVWTAETMYPPRPPNAP